MPSSLTAVSVHIERPIYTWSDVLYLRLVAIRIGKGIDRLSRVVSPDSWVGNGHVNGAVAEGVTSVVPGHAVLGFTQNH